MYLHHSGHECHWRMVNALKTSNWNLSTPMFHETEKNYCFPRTSSIYYLVTISFDRAPRIYSDFASFCLSNVTTPNIDTERWANRRRQHMHTPKVPNNPLWSPNHTTFDKTYILASHRIVLEYLHTLPTVMCNLDADIFTQISPFYVRRRLWIYGM